MPNFCWKFNSGFLSAAPLLHPFPKQLCPAAGPQLLQPTGKAWGRPLCPGLAQDRCLLANIQLPGNVESALLLFHLIFFTPCTGFFSSAAPAAVAFPRMAESAAAAIYAAHKVPAACLTSAALPRALISQALQANRQSSGSSSSGEWQQHSFRWWPGIDSGVKPGFTFCLLHCYCKQDV